MIGVVVPARNEEASVAQCIAAIEVAAACPRLDGETVRVFVSIDRCTDRTAQVAAAAGASVVRGPGGNVGLARAAGMDAAIAAGARWLACTDADSIVPADWLSAQVRCGADAFCGMVTVRDWGAYADAVRAVFERGHPRRIGHPHVHGANLGVSTPAYLACGGFRAGRAHEDVALVDALVESGARIARLPTPIVHTSARRCARARDGFADYLLALEARLAPGAPAGEGELTMEADYGT